MSTESTYRVPRIRRVRRVRIVLRVRRIQLARRVQRLRRVQRVRRVRRVHILLGTTKSGLTTRNCIENVINQFFILISLRCAKMDFPMLTIQKYIS